MFDSFNSQMCFDRAVLVECFYCLYFIAVTNVCVSTVKHFVECVSCGEMFVIDWRNSFPTLVSTLLL